MNYVRWHNGGWMRLGLIGRDNDAWLWTEVETNDVYCLDQIGLENIRRIVDLGASIGVFAAVAHKRWPLATITCVDPNVQTHELLELNAGQFATILKAAVFHGARPVLRRGDLDFQATVVADGGEGWESVPTVEVAPLLRPFCDLLKLDCEGCEYGVLAHEDLGNVRYVLGEWHDVRRWCPAVRRFLTEHPQWTYRVLRDSENGIFLLSNMEFNT